ncbi:MAG: hypothetical protein P1U84_05125 [Parvibaculaceae bacterium]|nr:hypothetical protein [Parvibaculaceae bacterium]
MKPAGYPRKASHMPSTGRSPASDDELLGMKKRAWHQLGLAVLDPSDVLNGLDRQHLINIANQLYGKRERGRV